ncbi:hypothetical protein DPMN_192967 [Dreissena polymorpha]|uniref:Uncharacterized protein n=1 Tax=Dreissena polymorpha TaxID=45954 RepID=A0A9D3Y1R1_DREPO|nr:hypothetical protein DPMN_192967 [Dreissena polymorpha]
MPDIVYDRKGRLDRLSESVRSDDDSYGNRKERIRRASCTLKCVRPRCSATSTTNDTLTTIVSNTCYPRVQLGKLIAGLSPF